MDEVVLVLDRLNRRLNAVERNQGTIVKVSSVTDVTDVTNNTLASAATITKSGTKAKKVKRVKTKKVKTTKKKNAQLTTPYIDPGTLNDVPNGTSRSAVAFGLLANIPVAGNAGALYLATDANTGTGGTTYVDTGSTWIPVAVGTSAGVTGWTPSLHFSISLATYGSPQAGGYFYNGTLLIAAFVMQLSANGSGNITLNLPIESGASGPIGGYGITGAVVFTNYSNMGFSAAGRSLLGNIPSMSLVANLYVAGETTGTRVLTSADLTATTLLEGIALYEI